MGKLYLYSMRIIWESKKIFKLMIIVIVGLAVLLGLVAWKLYFDPMEKDLRDVYNLLQENSVLANVKENPRVMGESTVKQLTGVVGEQVLQEMVIKNFQGENIGTSLVAFNFYFVRPDLRQVQKAVVPLVIRDTKGTTLVSDTFWESLAQTKKISDPVSYYQQQLVKGKILIVNYLDSMTNWTSLVDKLKSKNNYPLTNTNERLVYEYSGKFLKGKDDKKANKNTVILPLGFDSAMYQEELTPVLLINNPKTLLMLNKL